MKPVFADTYYYLALVSADDAGHARAPTFAASAKQQGEGRSLGITWRDMLARSSVLLEVITDDLIYAIGMPDHPGSERETGSILDSYQYCVRPPPRIQVNTFHSSPRN